MYLCQPLTQPYAPFITPLEAQQEGGARVFVVSLSDMGRLERGAAPDLVDNRPLHVYSPQKGWKPKEGAYTLLGYNPVQDGRESLDRLADVVENLSKGKRDSLLLLNGPLFMAMKKKYGIGENPAKGARLVWDRTPMNAASLRPGLNYETWLADAWAGFSKDVPPLTGGDAEDLGNVGAWIPRLENGLQRIGDAYWGGRGSAIPYPGRYPMSHPTRFFHHIARYLPSYWNKEGGWHIYGFNMEMGLLPHHGAFPWQSGGLYNGWHREPEQILILEGLVQPSLGTEGPPALHPSLGVLYAAARSLEVISPYESPWLFLERHDFNWNDSRIGPWFGSAPPPVERAFTAQPAAKEVTTLPSVKGVDELAQDRSLVVADQSPSTSRKMGLIRRLFGGLGLGVGQ